jgi:RNA polymerase sigma-70 factor (ECF subfamily)
MSAKMTISDEAMAQLLQRAQRYDPAAFDRLYELYADRIYRYVWYRVRDPDLAKDLAADVFERVIEHIATFRIGTQDTVVTFSGWLFRIAHNELYRFHRKREREESVLVTNEERRERPADARDLSELAEDYERQEVLLAAIARLPEDQQETLFLRFWEQLSHAEVAGLMGRSEGAIRALQHRALTTLRQILASYGPEAWR